MLPCPHHEHGQPGALPTQAAAPTPRGHMQRHPTGPQRAGSSPGTGCSPANPWSTICSLGTPDTWTCSIHHRPVPWGRSPGCSWALPALSQPREHPPGERTQCRSPFPLRAHSPDPVKAVRWVSNTLRGRLQRVEGPCARGSRPGTALPSPAARHRAWRVVLGGSHAPGQGGQESRGRGHSTESRQHGAASSPAPQPGTPGWRGWDVPAAEPWATECYSSAGEGVQGRGPTACTCARTCTHTPACMRAHTHACTPLHARARPHTPLHAHARTHVHALAHACTRPRANAPRQGGERPSRKKRLDTDFKGKERNPSRARSER